MTDTIERQAQRELEILHAFTQSLGVEGGRMPARAIVDGALAATHADFAIMFGVAPGRLVDPVHASNADYSVSSVVHLGECLCGRAAASGCMVYSLDIHDDPRCAYDDCKKWGVRSFVALPIRAPGSSKLLAVLGIGSRTCRNFEEQRAFLDVLSTIAALALDYQRIADEAAAEAVITQSMVSGVPGILYLFDESGRFIRWNANFEMVTGYSPSEIALLHPVDLFRGDDRDLVAQRIADVFANGSASIEATFVPKQGPGTPYYFTGVRTEHAGRPALIGIGIDISARVSAERSLRDLSDAVNASGDVVFMTDPQGVFTSVNSEFTRLYGIPAEDVLGKCTPRVLKSGVHGQPVYEAFWDSIRKGNLFRGEIVNRARDGRLVHVEETVNPFRDAQGRPRGFLAIQRDVTERRRAEQERDELREQYLAAQKLDAVGRLAGGIAHDFNNLLAVILNLADMVHASIEDEATRADVQHIHDAGERASQLTRQLLTFSRRQVVTPTLVNVSVLVSNLVAMLRRTLGEDIEIRTDLAPDAGQVRADKGQLEQVLMNLAVNARDAMPHGGTLTFATARQRATTDLVRIIVSDTGCGMDAETRQHAFEPFFTTKEVGRGTGLGLATVYGIVQQSGGTIELHTEPGRGTRFTIDFPRIEQPAEARSGAQGICRGTESILLVEDDEQVRQVTARVLSAAGYSVTLAENGAMAMEKCDTSAQPFDLVLTDRVMPGIGGEELATKLRERWPAMPILMMSGYAAAQPTGAFMVTAKPFTTASLTKAVRDALDRG